MKVLWICNVELPVISEHRGKKVNPYGGWLTALLDGIIDNDYIDVVICFPGDIQENGAFGRITYYSFVNDSVKTFEKILEKENPDVIHVFGTEMKHSYSMVCASEQLNMLDRVVVNIQGLVSFYAMHYYCHLENRIVKSWTIHDFLTKHNIYYGKKGFEKDGKYEKIILKKVKHIVGRTDWDKACVTQINKDAHYHYCGESLRNAFYDNKWDFDQCEKHMIFASQCGYPIKGFHLAIEAFKIVLAKFPDSKLVVAGKSPYPKSWINKIKYQSSYSYYLCKMIKKNGLEDNVIFTGPLDEVKMCNQYLKSNVFILPSSIENSPNSLGEAMILGVPCVAADVGGVSSMLKHKEEGFIYQGDAPYMLAYYICEVFNSRETAKNISRNAAVHAKNTHNREKNLDRMLEIYDEVLQSCQQRVSGEKSEK